MDSNRAVGVRIGNIAYHVTTLPGRKRMLLVRYNYQLNTLTSVASFYHDKEATEFLDWLLQFAPEVREEVEHGQAD